MEGCEFDLFQGKNSSSGKKICFSLIMLLPILLELTSITADGIYCNGDKDIHIYYTFLSIVFVILRNRFYQI